MAVTGTLFVTAALFRGREVSSVRLMRFVAPVGTAIGTLLVGLPFSAGHEGVAIASILGSLMTGVCSAWLWIMWGEFYGRIDAELAEAVVPASGAIVIVCLFFISYIRGPVAGVVIALLPVVSGLLLVLALSDGRAEERTPQLPLEERSGSWVDLLRIGVGSIAIFSSTAFVRAIVPVLDPALAGRDSMTATVIGSAFAVAVSLSTVFFSRRLNAVGIYRWMLPPMVISLALLAVGSHAAYVVSYTLATVATFGTDIVLWIYFSGLVHKGYSAPAVTFGVGRGFIQAGVMVGSLLGIQAVQWLAAGTMTVIAVALSQICVLVTIIVYVLGQQDRMERVILPAGHDSRSAEPGGAGLYAELAGARGLSPRETEILVYLASGRSIPYIREKLVLSKNTIETHAKHLYRKLGVHSRQELIDFVEEYKSPRP